MLRLEVSLFSGFELASITQIVVNPTESMAEMQHGYFANNIWFVFANISTNCPICVQYVVHSTFIISSLRPAFARIYPAFREDLAAETFFHAAEGSSLLKGTTDDDLITWFGKNSTRAGNFSLEQFWVCEVNGVPVKEKTTTEAPQSTTPIPLLNTNTPYSLHKIENLSVVTYTINVDNNSINNLSEALPENELIVPTAIIFNENTTEVSDQQSSTMTTPNIIDNIIIQEKDTEKKVSGYSEEVLQKIDALDDGDKKYKRNPEIEEMIKKTIQTIANPTNYNLKETNVAEKSTNKSGLNTTIAKPMDVKLETTKPPNIITTSPFTTPTHGQEETETSTKFVERVSKELIVDTNVSPPKHINVEKHNVPLKLIQNAKEEEGRSVTFAPEIKNDRYLLLDKEELWGMLREAVSDEMNKKKQDISANEYKTLT